ncbi:bifunctional precorrin-2 dehydrogenase/sirohydrochlorin ferrochelatase [Ruminiclostridium herbifermentans]|uniref:precorrin-2 dehydrogenase n=1 Tax=Ruminiclostridium herbifermentans TaxID=2488810 RepID=A0A7H1VIP6_9FIRM|nr:bifunctional precorrin-2 dehydrogenase/sirohydrochlorin ferrochelatase [Ruminiclostridium herbifermentans]
MFINLNNKKCVVIGGGEVASRKVEVLLRYKADLTVIAPEFNPTLIDLEINKKIKLIKREYSEGDIDTAALIVAATSSPMVNERVYRDAVKSNIPVNVVDNPYKCTFFFPSVVNRGDLTIGISTSGKYPALAKKIRKVTEKYITEDYSEIVSLLADFRLWVSHSNLSKKEREKILAQVLDEFYDKGNIKPQALLDILLNYKSKLSIRNSNA